MIVVVIVLIVLISTQSIFNLSGTEEESDDQIISTVLIERRDLRTFEKKYGGFSDSRSYLCKSPPC